MPRYKWDKTPENRAERKKRILDSILQEAARAFNARGYHKTSLDDIAKAQNVTKPTLYYYIRNKEDILVKCEDKARELINGLLDEVVKPEKTGLEILKEFIRGYIPLVTDDVIRCHIRFRGRMDSPELRKRSNNMHRAIELRVREVVARGVADGSLSTCTPTVVTLLLFGTLNGISYWYRDEGALSHDDIYQEALKMFMAGLAQS